MSELIELTRKQFYDAVWSTPMLQLSKQYGFSDVGLAKTCKQLNIPRPPRGYWMKLAYGKKVQKPPLPGDSCFGLEEIVFSIRKSGPSTTNANVIEAPKPPEFDPDIVKLLAIARSLQPIVVPEILDKPHRLIRVTRRNERERKKRHTDLYSPKPTIKRGENEFSLCIIETSII